MPYPYLLRVLVVLAFIPSACSSAPPKEGFTDIAIANSRQSLNVSAGSTKVAHWDSLILTMLESSGVLLATLQDITLTLAPGKDGTGKDICNATLTATLSATQWCTSTTYNQGLGQVLQVYLEKTGHALVLPWTLGAIKVEARNASQALRYNKVLDAKILDVATEVQLVVQPALWMKCP